jgi:hypothetical protein
MRRHLRVGDENPRLPEAYALQAYCAWVLDDRDAVSQALQRAEDVSRGEPVYYRIRALKAAMEAALR